MVQNKILYIDDEIINLTNFVHTFGREYELLTAANGEQALALLKEKGPVNLVIADQRMPGITGIDVLYNIRELYPDTIRMVLTAFTETNDLIDAINRGHVFRYIVKPWDENELRQAIKHALDTYYLALRNKQLLSELQEKNQSLSSMNVNLEELVAERTKELFETNKKLAKTNNELHKKIQELTRAQEDVKSLQNLIPICSYCKKIRDARDLWHDLDLYMQSHSQLKFTHSVCPKCYESKIKPELADLKARAINAKQPGNDDQ